MKLFFTKKFHLDPDPHLNIKFELDPDPQKINADPKPRHLISLFKDP